MVTAEILDIFLTNIVSFIQLTTKLYYKQPISSLFTQIFMKYLQSESDLLHAVS